MGSKRLTPTIVGKIASKRFFFVVHEVSCSAIASAESVEAHPSRPLQVLPWCQSFRC